MSTGPLHHPMLAAVFPALLAVALDVAVHATTLLALAATALLFLLAVLAALLVLLVLAVLVVLVLILVGHELVPFIRSLR